MYLLRAKNPIVNLRVFADRNFALSWFSIAMMGFVLYASAVVIPQFAQQVLGYNATWAGLVLAPGAVVLVLLIPIVGRMLATCAGEVRDRRGGLALGGSLWFSMSLVPDIDFFHLALLPRGADGGAGAAVRADQRGRLRDGAGGAERRRRALFSMARNVYGGVGISVSTALVTDHQQIRQAHMVEWLSPT